MSKEEDFRDLETSPFTRESRFLLDVVDNPISTVVDRYKRLGINRNTGNKWKDFWIEEGFIIPKRIITKSGWFVLFEITPKGAASLRTIGHHVNTFKHESIEHKFWKLKIAEFYAKKGYHVAIEQEDADIVIEGRNKIAVEIETGNSDHLRNINRNLWAGFDSVICVPTNAIAQHRISEDLKRNEIGKNVQIIPAMKFDVSLKPQKEMKGKYGIL